MGVHRKITKVCLLCNLKPIRSFTSHQLGHKAEMSIKVIELLEMLYRWPMYNFDSIIKHTQIVEAKIAKILKAKANRKPNFNEEELEANPSRSQTQNLNLDHHEIIARTTTWPKCPWPGRVVLAAGLDWGRKNGWGGSWETAAGAALVVRN